MAKSKESLLSVLLYFLLVIVVIGLIRTTWKAMLISFILGCIVVFFFPDIFISELISSDPPVEISLSPEELNSLRPEQIGMAAGAFYFLYLGYLFLTGRLIMTLVGDKFSQALSEAEKVTRETPGLEAEIKQFSKDSLKLKQDMENFCKEYPDDPLCTSHKGYGQTFEAEY